jgi:hypothetical protein
MRARRLLKNPGMSRVSYLADIGGETKERPLKGL